MKQGTISVLFGCHSVVHSYYVLKAWKKIYGEWPEPWELMCILVHDVGHWGLDYLDDPNLKSCHWKLGADIAGSIYGAKGYAMVAGHCSRSQHPPSKLRLPDKTSWTLAPTWWVALNALVEPKLRRSNGLWRGAKDWKATVHKYLKRNPDLPSLHDVYLEQMGES